MKKLLRVVLITLLLTAIGGLALAETPTITLRVWVFWSPAWMEPAVERFRELHPDVEIVIERLSWVGGFDKIVAAIAAGEAPDIVELGSTWVPGFIDAEAIIPLDVAGIKEKYTGWAGVAKGGNYYGIPWVAATNIMHFNTDLVIRAGFDPENPPETWSEFKALAEAIHALGPEYYGYAVVIGGRYTTWHQFMPFAWSNETSILNEDWTESMVASERFIEALEFYDSLVDSGLLSTKSGARTAFYLGKIGIILDGPGLAIAKNAPDLQYHTALIPRPDRPGTRSIGFAGAQYIHVTAQSNHPELAQVFAVILSQGNLISNRIPALLPFYKPDRVDLLETHWSPALEVYLAQLEGAASPAPHPAWEEMMEHLIMAVESTVLGRGTAARNLERAHEEITWILEEWK